MSTSRVAHAAPIPRPAPVAIPTVVMPRLQYDVPVRRTATARARPGQLNNEASKGAWHTPDAGVIYGARKGPGGGLVGAVGPFGVVIGGSANVSFSGACRALGGDPGGHLARRRHRRLRRGRAAEPARQSARGHRQRDPRRRSRDRDGRPDGQQSRGARLRGYAGVLRLHQRVEGQGRLRPQARSRVEARRHSRQQPARGSGADRRQRVRRAAHGDVPVHGRRSPRQPRDPHLRVAHQRRMGIRGRQSRPAQPVRSKRIVPQSQVSGPQLLQPTPGWRRSSTRSASA